jgi:hypothetical protein
VNNSSREGNWVNLYIGTVPHNSTGRLAIATLVSSRARETPIEPRSVDMADGGQ